MADTVQDLIRKAAAEAGVPPALALAVAEQESGFNPTVFGPEIEVGGQKTRAVGTFQLLPDTAKGLGVDPMDPRQNIVGGVKYLRQLLDQHQGDLTKVLGTYGGVVRNTTYVPGVLERMQKFTTTAPPTYAPGTQVMRPDLPAHTRLSGPTPSTMADVPLAARLPGPAPSTVTDRPAATPTTGASTLLQSMAAGFDPRTTEGRIGLAATAGGLALTAATGGIAPIAGRLAYTAAGPRVVAGVAPWITRVLGPVLGAGTAGAGQAAIEQTAGQDAPSPTVAGLQQGAYEVGGRLFMWPIRRVGSALLASRVGKQASEGVARGIETARESGRQAITAVRSRVQDGLDAARAVAEATREALVTRGRAAVTAARQGAATQSAEIGRRAGAQEVQAKLRAAELLADAELANSDAITALTRQYDNLLAGPPSTTMTGQLTREAVQGPAKRALDLAGQRVAEAAQSGPMIAITPLQGALDEMASKARPAALFPAKELPKGIGFLTGAIAARPAGAAAGQRMSREEFQRAIAGQLGVDETHPLPGILGQLQDVKLEQLPFQDVHRLKMLLDEAVNWDRPAKKHLEKITKGLRTAVREALAVYEPYNVATAAYQAMVPLYRRGIGKQVITAALNDPDKIARMLKPDNPAQALAMRDLLVTQSAAGGDAHTGQRAWDHVRSAFTYTHVIKGGLEGLSDRVHRLVEQSPEFAKVVFDDEPAQKILSNLDRLGQAFTQAQQQGAARIATAKATGKTLVESAKTYGAEEVADAAARSRAQVGATATAAAQAVRAARQQGRDTTRALAQQGRSEIRTAAQAARAAVSEARALQRRLRGSTLHTGTVQGQLGDVLRAALLAPHGSLWGTLSLVRLLSGPKASDLVEWAAYSDAHTQRLVAGLTGTLPDRAMAGLIREVASVLYPPAHEEAAGP